ncbi:hypothetical protein BTJ39_13650 [Izhakiella australiensis]|uniref:Pilus assembly protein HofP n=1 Tax=Izhakiella australiensis TaxID=1926881 RepID=A0A1S8YKX0_9GAMM|nr:hypothetical protein BTJ39_13650 [Izhakiella australiensis]
MSRLWLLLLLCNGAQGRDPFLPPAPDCVSRPAPPSSWRLLGVIGSDGRLVSRWQSPHNHRFMLVERSRLRRTQWQIVRIDFTGVTLSWQGQCRTSDYFYSLKKGQRNAYMDVAPAAGSDAKRSGSRADGFPDIQRGAG